MQQRVNRWLNPELMSARQLEPLESLNGLEVARAQHSLGRLQQEQQRSAELLFLERPSTPRAPASQSWQRIAALVMLLGSAAFSYVAWSKVPVTYGDLQPEAPAATAPQSALPQVNKAQQQLMHGLREENRRLYSRIAQLREELNGTAKDA